MISNLFEEGLDMLQKENFDVMLIDAPMPGYEQLNTVRELDKKGLLQSHKVILFTAMEKIIKHSNGLQVQITFPTIHLL